MNWKNKTILFYAAIGLAVGLIAGKMTVDNAVENNKEVTLNLENGAKVGMSAMAAMRKAVLK